MRVRDVLGLLMLSGLLFGCGSSGTSSTSSVSSSPAANAGVTVEELSQLPVCDETTAGVLAYVKGENDLYSCKEGQWASVGSNKNFEPDLGARAPGDSASED